MTRDLPSPEQIIEDLADKVALQIDRLAPVAFDNALRELTRYHRFLLSVNASRTPDGEPFSYAEVPGDAWHAPHLEWIRQYRRLFERAADRIPDDDHFIGTLAYVGGRLLPRPGDPELSPGVLRGILDLGPLMMHRLEAWVTKRTTIEVPADEAAKPRLTLAGSDAKAYANVITGVVGAWESLLQVTPNLFGWREGTGAHDAERWGQFRASWPYMWQHLQNTAYALSVAVWNEDEAGAALLRDALVRWPETLSHALDETAELRNRRMLFPDILHRDWDGAVAQITPLMYEHMPTPSAEELFGSIVRGAHNDAILLTAAVFINWTISDKQASDIGGRTAAAMLRRELAESDERRPRPDLSFTALFLDLVRLELSGKRYDEGTYGDELDRFVATIDNMTERRVVPGRVYTPSTLHDRDGLLLAAVMLLAVHVPGDGDNGLQVRVADLAKNEALLPKGDRSLRDILDELRRYAVAAEQIGQQFQHFFELFGADLDPATAAMRVGAIVGSTISEIEAERLGRIKERAIDAAKMERIRAAMELALLTEPVKVPFFSNAQIKIEEENKGELRDTVFTNIEKAQLLEPPMAAPMSNFDEHLASRVRTIAGEYIWNDFTRRSREVVKVAAAAETDAFWQAVGPLIERVGPGPQLILSREAEGRALRRFVYRFDNDFGNLKIERKPRNTSGGAYIATIEGVDVFGADFPPGMAWLFSARELQAIHYGKVSDVGGRLSLTFELTDQLVVGALRARFRQQAVWANLPIFELHMPDPDDSESANN